MLKTVDFYTLLLRVKSQKRDRNLPLYKSRQQKYDIWQNHFLRSVHLFQSVQQRRFLLYNRASPHHEHNEMERAIVGYFELNLDAITLYKADMINRFGTLVHEFYYILVFNNALYEKFIKPDKSPMDRGSFINENVVVGTGTRMGYKGSNLITWENKFLIDGSLTYIHMENYRSDGSVGRHWEHRCCPQTS